MLRPPLAASLAGGAAATLVVASVLLSDGSSDSRLTYVGAGALLAAGVGVVAVLLGLVERPPLSRRAWAFLGLLAAFVAWNGLSVLWSIEPDRTWSYFNRGLSYLALAVVGVFVGAYLGRVVVLAVRGLAVVFAVAVGWALLVKAVPRLDSYEGRIARLNAPIGYWNALALLIDMALPIALWLAARREHHPALRAAATVFLYADVLALLLTYSRAGIAVGVIGIAVWLVVGSPRLESAVALAVGGIAGAGVALWAFSRPGLANDQEPYTVRFHDGIWFAVVVVLAGAVVAGVTFLLARLDQRAPLPPYKREAAGRLAVAGLVVVVLAAAAFLVARGAGPSRLLRDFEQPVSAQASSGPGRIAALSSNGRARWWRAAWHAVRAHPLEGTGAGSFELTDRRYRTTGELALEPHSLPLQFLTETGVVGLLLALGALVAGALAVVRRRRVDHEGAAWAALFVIPVVYLVHSLVDFDWDFVSVTAPFFVVVGVLIARERPAPGRSISRLWAAGAALFCCAAIYSLASPWLAERKVNDAFSALGHGHTRTALADAEDAQSLNPLALQPLFAAAAAQTLRGKDIEARRLYVRAVRLQPLNYRAWYELGVFELAYGDPARAHQYLHRAAVLDPQGPAKPFLAG